MRLIAHQHAVLKVLAVAAAVLAGAPSQAALTNLTLDSGLQVSQDAATGLLWRSFDDASLGAKAGFRQATVADFDTLLRNNGYAATGSLPSGLANLGTAPIVIKPEVVTITTSEVFTTRDRSPVPQAFLDQQAIIKAQYVAKLASGDAILSAEDITTEYYNLPMMDLKEQYGVVYSKMVTQTTVTPAVTVMPPSLNAGGVSASYYSSNDSYGFRVANTHQYDNSYPFAVEYHYTFMGQLASDDGFWVGATTSNYIPHQCSPGDSGYNPYGYNVQYCGGRSYTSGYLGPSAFTEFDTKLYSRTDYTPGVKPVGYLMVQGVPEPSTYALMGLGLVGIAGLRARRSQPDAA
jgi:hypothetical protein